MLFMRVLPRCPAEQQNVECWPANWRHLHNTRRLRALTTSAEVTTTNSVEQAQRKTNITCYKMALFLFTDDAESRRHSAAAAAAAAAGTSSSLTHPGSNRAPYCDTDTLQQLSL